jgi:tRNA (guanine6-N2)-methyltransferase
MNKSAKNASQARSTLLCCDVVPGLKPWACQEIVRRFGRRAILLPSDDPEAIYLRYTGDLHELFDLRMIVAVSLLEIFAVPRPRALLGHQHYHRLLEQIEQVRRLHPPRTFVGLRISAAGASSSVFSQLKAQLQSDTNLPADVENADLLLRVRPARYASSGWEVLLRLTPRPLATRGWRVYQMKGAMNATVAAAMVEMTDPHPDDRFLNLMCGSGTLLIERLLRGPAAVVVGCDLNSEALRGAQQNLEQSHTAGKVLLCQADATQLPFLPASFRVLCADVPWGQLTGSHETNRGLYPRLLTEAARLAEPSGIFALLTHEIALLESLLPTLASVWELQQEVKILQGGLHPRIYLLRRTRTPLS